MADDDEAYGVEEHDTFETEEYDQDDVDGGTRDDVSLCCSHPSVNIQHTYNISQ